MSHSQQTYHTVFQRLDRSHALGRVTRTRNLALLVTALYLAGSCHLTRLADRLLVEGCKDSRVQRLRRFLMNDRIGVAECYQGTVQAVLAHPGNARMVLILDHTTIGNWLNILSVSMAYHGRALPLAWKVFKKQGRFQRCHIESLLRRVANSLPDTADPRQIWVVGDREFQDVALQAFVEHTLGWNYVQRIPRNLWLYPDGQPPFQPSRLDLQPGQTFSVANVAVTRQHAGPAHFLAFWKPGEKEPWFLLSNRPVGRETLHVYKRRFWTEPMYRDFKSYGWNIEASRITDPKRFARLLLGIALAYVWLLQLASQVIKSGGRRLVDRTTRRTLSYFRIGWNWLLRRLDHDRPIALPDLLYA